MKFKQLRSYESFVQVNREELLRQWHAYCSNPNVDYCPGEGICNHSHTFERFARNEYDAYVRESNFDQDCAEGF